MIISQDTPTPDLDKDSSAGEFQLNQKAVDGRYEVLKLLGEGGMGKVYKAEDSTLKRIVAIKVMTHQAISPSAAKRFQLEAKAASALKSENIIDVYDFGISNEGFPFMVMEYLKSRSLHTILKSHKSLSLQETLNITKQICLAMIHAHDQKIVHRDLKPGNIAVSKKEGQLTVKILDFGISKIKEDKEEQYLTKTGEIVGSPKYLSPEQAQGQDVDARADIYSLGCIIYECLTGSAPFQSDSMLETMFMHINNAPISLKEMAPDKDFSQPMEKLVAKCLAKDPKDRFQTMGDLLNALKDCEPQTLVTELDIDSVIEEDSVYEEADKILKQRASTSVLLILGIVCVVTLPLIGYAVFETLNPLFESTQKQQTDILSKTNAKDHLDKAGNAITSFGGYKSMSLQQLKNTNIRKEVKIFGVVLTNEQLQYLCSKPIKKLIIETSELSREQTKIIGKSKTIDQLILKYSSLNDDSFEPLTNMEQLKRLNVEGNINLTKKILPMISNKFPNLASLDIGHTNIKGKDLKLLTGPNALALLDVQNLKLKDEDLVPLMKLPNILELDLIYNPDLTENSLAIVGKYAKSKKRRVVLHMRNLPNFTDKQYDAAEKKYGIDVANYVGE